MLTCGSDGIRTLDYDFSELKLHERQEIVDPLPATKKLPHGRYSVSLTRIPQDQWAEIAHRHAKGESLRKLSKWYGVSHEAVRQVLKRHASDPT